MLFKSLVLLSLVGVAFCALAHRRLPPIPKKFANKEGCYIEEIDDVIPFGTSVTPIGYCYRISCGNPYITYASCGKIGVYGDDLFVTDIDLTKPYPDCCPRVERISNNKI